MGAPNKFTLNVASGASLSSSVDLGGSFLYVSIEVPTMSAFGASTPLYIQGSSDGSTFRRVSNLESNTSVAGVNDYIIASSCSQRLVPIANFGFRYLKIETSSTAANGAAFNVICSQNQ